MGARASLLILLACVQSYALLACHSDEQAGPPLVSPPDVRPPEAAPSPPKTVLPGHITFAAPGETKKILSLQELTKEFPLQEIESEDPNYDALKMFFAIPLAPLLRKVFPSLDGARLLLQATDGYSVEVDAALLLSEDAFLALGDRAPGAFAPIGERKVNAGPSYVVWRGSKYTDDKRYPRPWSLSVIEKMDTADRYLHTRPEGGFGENDSAKRGYELFSASCIRCHAINREGGRLGPDLNVPQNILAYRPEEQVRAYIRDPKIFRYSSMPAHPEMSESDLDALVAYLSVMAENQSDPDAN